MNVFVDTSAFLAVLNAADRYHPAAAKTWQELLSSDSTLLSSNYVLLETVSILQHRFGLDAVRLFETDVTGIIEVMWVDEDVHRQAMIAMLASNRRKLSLVDCASFALMRQAGLDTVFTFDSHFTEQGFRSVPSSIE